MADKLPHYLNHKDLDEAHRIFTEMRCQDGSEDWPLDILTNYNLLELTQGKGEWMRLAHTEETPEWLHELIAYISCVKTKPRRMKVLKELAARLKVIHNTTIHTH
jgi:hypothetical protein